MRIACLWIPGWSTGAVSNPPTSAGSSAPASSSASPTLNRLFNQAGSSSNPLSNLSNPLSQADSPERAKLEAALLEVVPRLRIEGCGRVWADVRGLDARRCVEQLCERLAEAGWREIGAGVSALPVTAAVAARSGPTPRFVPVGGERDWLSAQPLEVLEPDGALLTLLGGVGIEQCGELAVLPREAVEVR